MEEVKAEKIKEVILEEKEYTKKELEKEIKKIVQEKEKAREIYQEVARERAEIKVTKKADEIAVKTCEELKQDQVLVTEKMIVELKESILKSWKDGDKVEIPESITKAVHSEVILEKTRKASENFKKENLESIVHYRAEELGKEVSYKLRENGVKDEKLIANYVEVLQDLNYNSGKIVSEENRQDIYNYVNNYVNDQNKLNKSPGQIEASIDEAQFMAKNVVRAPREFNRSIRRYNELRELIGADRLPKIKEIRITEKMTSLFKNSPGVLKFMNGAQRMVGFLDKINNFPANLLSRFGFQDVGLKIVERIGGEAATAFLKNAAAIIAKEGTLNGVKSILMGLLGKGAVAAGSGAAGGAALAGGLAAIPGIRWIAAAAVAAVGILKKIGGKINNWLKDKLNINLDGTSDFLSNILGLKGVGKGIIGLVGKMGTFFAGLPAMLGSTGALVGSVFVVVMLFLVGCTMSNQGMVSTLVPPADNGNCVLASEYNGTINCNPSAPENNVAGLNKSAFIDVANRWKNGTNYASTCINDTINRALCKGINPTYALWAWLHESGASNYTNADDIEDFGIHNITQNEDFNAQINEFVTLDPATGCINDSRIGGDYWLAFSANYLNGSNCDPDYPNAITGMTPRQYEAELKSQWGWFSSSPLPSNIHVTAAGKNCDTAFQAYYSGNAQTKTIDGKEYVCTETTQSVAGGPGYDANSPGLTGVVVDGECSVGEVVVPTKQCDSQWGSIQLNGGNCSNGKPGTICSAGCGPTSVSMLLRHINGTLTPNNVIFNTGSAYSSMGCEGSGLDQAQTELGKYLGSSAITYDATTQGCDEKAIAKWICGGKVVMVLANFYRNSKLELGGHYILAIGIKDGKIVVADPFYSVTDTPFDGTVAYGYAHDIKGCLLIDKTAVK